ncbi:hypothetical protein HJ055_22485 [Vibrio parahaemolyticus]|nr:hypothetical protein [Vibrio parahaemolyticus]MBE4164555.1 hypothetical protein [Vibrio parahaemolyticus]MBE4354801.1 hypothetical protein [Vibrio parahaemolyticus]TOK67535.1 hypothetical protein CGI14_14230 [Vibrio parahaemolyticus]TON57940.1 hypothetical protein CGH54_23945 [Vibrio parahaemolyticus]
MRCSPLNAALAFSFTSVVFMKIIEYLKSFNRKERFHLVGQLLGNSEFNLDPNVLRKILDLLQLDTPTCYFSAMDYHLDWIYASLDLAFNYGYEPKLRDYACISATQEDVDFILAFVDDSGNTHIIMIEAKGDTTFTNKQLQSKASRLSAIFGKNNEKWVNVRPHFLICSPVKPTQLKTENIPSFMLNKENNNFNWFSLYMPENQRKVTRCHSNGEASVAGQFWKVDTLRRSKS